MANTSAESAKPALTDGSMSQHTHGQVRRYDQGCRCDQCLDAKERQREYDRERYRVKCDEIKARSKARYYDMKRRGVKDPMSESRREHKRQMAAAWYRSNKNRALDAARVYRQTERGRLVHQVSSALRRSRLRGAPGFCTIEQAQARVDYFGGLCSYCHEAPFEHLDHAIPVSRGGTSWPSNLRPACSQCNLSKWTKTWKEFLAA